MALGWRVARYINPVLAALKDLGGSARPREVYDWIAQHLGISDEERSIRNQSGPSRFENDVAWARFYLVRTGYLESSRHGVWSLTDQGRAMDVLSEDEIDQILLKISNQAAQTEEPAPEDVPRGYRERTLEILQSLPPQGFERLCQRLLRESGFQQVRVTGKSGDGGIDGIGILQVNPFVSFKVLFQCKRWSNAVGPAVVRDFRGAMMGRADKGLLLTTGVFTTEAQSEAVRDGASPIELVDGQAFISLLEQLQLGLLPRTTYEVDEKFFSEFA